MDAAKTRRVALLVEYDGTNYRGLQRQAGDGDTIQSCIEKACATLGSAEARFIACGRTDAGVHALGQVIAVDLPIKVEPRRIHLALNHLLPNDIKVRRAEPCRDDFNPRLDAIGRAYLYRISFRRDVSPLLRNFVAWKNALVNPELLSAAAECFKGKWELREWRASSCQAVRTFLTIDEAAAIPPDASDPMRAHWSFRFRARSFLHHQVRFMVGGIAAVGNGKLSLEDLSAALAEGKRPHAAGVEPANGLCLMSAEYPPDKNPFPADNLSGNAPVS
ncbi:tRNA pseudouridine(38-40) synthase TruA [soil metagenome]